MRRCALVALALFAASLPMSPAPLSASPGGLAAGPTLQQLSLATGSQGALHVELKNMSDDAPLPVQMQMTDLDPSGALRPVGSTPQTLVGALSLPAGQVVLSPGEKRTLDLAARGDGRTHFGAVLVLAGPAEAPFARIVLRVVLAPLSANPKPEFQLNVRPTGLITLHIVNSDQTICVGQGALFLLRPDGTFLGRLDVPEFELLPQATTLLTLRWPEPLPAGTTARAALAVNGRTTPFIVSTSVP